MKAATSPGYENKSYVLTGFIDRSIRYHRGHMTTRSQKILGWTPTVLLALFMIFASGLAKFFIRDGTPAVEFTKALGVWDHLYLIGALEIIAAVLLLVPRTATLGFVMMVGVLGGATATGLTHDVEGNWPWFPFVLILVMMIGAYFRTPELLARARDPRSVPNPGKAGTIASWVLTVLLSLATLASGVLQLMPPPNAEGAAFIERLGIAHIAVPLGITKICLAILFLIPRCSVIALVLMIGYFSGALATNMTRGFTLPEYLPLIFVLVLLAITGWIRNPELRQRLLGRPVSA
ncbi:MULTISPECIES: DoxX family protein [Sorangium]|uniref:DoxX family protein n=1 Tax=Sorangium TaxID=39643 RepID=UPI003D9C42CD